MVSSHIKNYYKRELLFHKFINNKNMKFVKFLKLINKKVNKYDKIAHTNPFEFPLKHYTIVWIEDSEKNYYDKI